MLPTRSAGDVGGDLDGVVPISGVDQVDPGQLFLRFGERAVGHEQPAVSDPHGHGRVHGLQGLRGDRVTALLKFIVERDVLFREKA